jgi:hypothetical protein
MAAKPQYRAGYVASVIPAKAGIQSDDSTFPNASGAVTLKIEGTMRECH